MFVLSELSHDNCPVHGVYTTLTLAVLSAIRVEENGATDDGLSIEVFDADQDIQLENVNYGGDTSTIPKYIDREVLRVERIYDNDITIQITVSNPHIAELQIDMVTLIDYVCAAAGFNIKSIKRFEDVDYFELYKE